MFVLSSGGLTRPAVKRILSLSGYDVRLGVPGEDDLVGVWGNAPITINGEIVPTDRKTGMIRIEDAWLRSLFPGRGATPPIGLLIDTEGAHYDASRPSDLETLLSTHPLDDTVLLDRARGAIERLKEAHLTKYSAVDPDSAVPPPGYVLVIDQTEGDASVDACGADRNRFLEMLFVAQEEHPGAPVLIKSHPETAQGFRTGYFNPADTRDRITFFSEPISPWTLLDGAIAVYTVSSQLGFEAIFAGHKPRVFGSPFYAGWGLTDDEFPVQRRQRRLSRAQLFAAAMLLYPKWYDPFADALCSFENALEVLAAETRAWREDRHGWVASGVPEVKQEHVRQMFGAYAPVQFEDAPASARASGKSWMVWAKAATVGHRDASRLAKGLLPGIAPNTSPEAAITMALDGFGDYENSSKPTRLEKLISARAELRPDQRRRAEALIRHIRSLKPATDSVTNLDTPPHQRCILVLGEDPENSQDRRDAKVLQTAKSQHPDAFLIYAPAPGTEGRTPLDTEVIQLADLITQDPDPLQRLDRVCDVWTVASPLGLHALIRKLPVTTLGAPFYAGWNLTNDLGDIPPRRRAEPDLAGLVHACLIDYPRYVHPGLQRACPVEAILAWSEMADQRPLHRWQDRIMARVQNLFSSTSVS